MSIPWLAIAGGLVGWALSCVLLLRLLQRCGALHCIRCRGEMLPHDGSLRCNDCGSTRKSDGDRVRLGSG